MGDDRFAGDNENPYAAPASEDVILGAAPGACPLCGDGHRMVKAKQLYGHAVCRKCVHGFANRRQFAYVIDTILMQLLIFPLAFCLAYILQLLQTPIEQIELAANFSGWLFFPLFCCKDGVRGYSPGKYLCGVRVIHGSTGQPAGLGMAFRRNLPLVIPIVPLAVAIQLLKGHRLGDRWAHSKVIWTRYADRAVFASDTGL